MAKEKVLVPDIGEYDSVDVIEVNVNKGDILKKETTLITLETDKATMEIPSPRDGVVSEISLKVGDKVSEGDLILILESAEGDAAAAGKKDEGSDEKAVEPDTDKTDDKKTAAPAKASPAKADKESLMDVVVPDIGEHDQVDIIEVSVSEGDTVTKEQTLITLETDKATMEIPAPLAGMVKQIKVKVGDKVSEGDLILTLISVDNDDSEPKAEVEEKSTDAAAPSIDTEVVQPEPQAPQKAQAATSSFVHAGPSVRQFAKALGIDLSAVTGSGRKGRITREDLARHVKGQMQGGTSGGLGLLADPVVDFAKYGEVEVVPLSRIKKISGANLARNWVRIPHITLFDEADITAMEEFRKAKKAEAEKQGVKLTPVPFIVKTVASALQRFPVLNASLAPDEDNLVMKKYINIGVAVDAPNGLMVPVIKNADQKSLYSIAKELMELSIKARDGKLSPSDMKGGTFTISSLGSLGTTAFAPIVNMPEVAILGVSKAQVKPVFQQDAFVPRLMLPLSLSLDHRVVDGAEGARFLTTLTHFLGDLREILL